MLANATACVELCGVVLHVACVLVTGTRLLVLPVGVAHCVRCGWYNSQRKEISFATSVAFYAFARIVSCGFETCVHHQTMCGHRCIRNVLPNSFYKKRCIPEPISKGALLGAAEGRDRVCGSNIAPNVWLRGDVVVACTSANGKRYTMFANVTNW